MSKWCFTLLLLFTGCPEETPHNVQCDVKAVADCPSHAPTYVDVKPLFDTHCNICHGQSDEVWPLDNYDDISAWQLDIRGNLLDCSMPPADAGTHMTLEEKTQILSWVRCGLPH